MNGQMNGRYRAISLSLTIKTSPPKANSGPLTTVLKPVILFLAPPPEVVGLTPVSSPPPFFANFSQVRTITCV